LLVQTHSAPIVVENVLSHKVDIRYGVAADPAPSSKPQPVVMQSVQSIDRNLERGKVRHLHTLDAVTYTAALSVSIPELKFGWSEPIALKRAADESASGKQVLSACMRDDDGHELRINLEVEYTCVCHAASFFTWTCALILIFLRVLFDLILRALCISLCTAHIGCSICFADRSRSVMTRNGTFLGCMYVLLFV
jgi:hypothetical protein